MTTSRRIIHFALPALFTLTLLCSCTGGSTAGDITASPTADIDVRLATIPADAVKMTPEMDGIPPIMLSDEFEDPIPVPGHVNTAGGEDSPFVTSDGQVLYFFFTPDVRIPVEEQVSDGITGIYVSSLVDGKWGIPHRVMLQKEGKLSIDGCEYVNGDIMWFCTAREGYTGLHWFTATFSSGAWRDWKLADFDPSYEVGELYITPDGSQLYFGSERAGGKGQMDIWMSQNVDGQWQEPVNISVVNTADGEGWPALSIDGSELWFYRNYSIWRSLKVDGEWQEPEQIVSPLAGEPTLDRDGNLYFVHHYYEDDTMIEADIYVAYRKK